MTNTQIVEELTALGQLDVDAVIAYDRAIAAIGDGAVARQLAEFKVDHERHVLDLSRSLLALGVQPPAFAPDLKGAFLGGMTAVRSWLGTEQALRAMRANEQLTTSSYARALAKPFPADVLEVVRRGDQDERRHLAWMERALERRLWEAERAAQP